MKRILFIAPSYLDLYKLILKELQVLAEIKWILFLLSILIVRIIIG